VAKGKSSHVKETRKESFLVLMRSGKKFAGFCSGPQETPGFIGSFSFGTLSASLEADQMKSINNLAPEVTLKDHVLLLTKDASVRASLASLLQSLNYHVAPAADHQEAVNALSSGRVGRGVVDINGGAARDWENFRALTTAHPWLPIILLAATPDSLTHPLAGRAQACFQKPLLDVPSFLDKLSELSSPPSAPAL
jgi:CheY-like chemotaxis protein